MNTASKDTRITDVQSREVLDSHGRPVVEVDIWTTNGSRGRGASPCGTSVGKHEAFVLRDGTERFGGLGVQNAVDNVEKEIAPALMGKSVLDQYLIDNVMNELDGTPDKSNLGANAIYSTSIAVARAAANCLQIPLYQYLGGIFANTLPLPMFNVINGGPYSNTEVCFQEFLLIPVNAESFNAALRSAVEVFYLLEDTIKRRYGEEHVQLGHLAGYAAPVKEPSEILETLLAAIKAAGYEGKFKLGLDCAASHFYDADNDCYNFQGKPTSRDEMIDFYKQLADEYPLVFIEDPLDEDDFEGFSKLTTKLNLVIAGDDLFVTNLKRLRKGIELGAGNAMVFKPNMIGTITEALNVAQFAHKNDYYLVPSGRSGGSNNDPITEIGVAIGGQLTKVGAPRTAERTGGMNKLLRIEEEFHGAAHLASLDFHCKEK